jgi:hypothetical protein
MKVLIIMLGSVSLAACGAASTGDADAGLDAGPTIQVNGRVVTTFDPGPVARARVWVDGRVVEADEDGRFTIDGVSVPYDAAAVTETGGRASLYLGLTRPDPTLEVMGTNTIEYVAYIEGNLSGAGGYPQTDQQQTNLAFVADLGGGMKELMAGEGPGYHLGAQWSGETSKTGTVYAVQSEDDPTYDRRWIGYAEFSQTVMGGYTHTGIDIALDAVGTGTLTGSVESPSGWEPTWISLDVEGVPIKGPNVFFPDPPAIAMPAPVIPGKTVRLRAWAHPAGQDSSLTAPDAYAWIGGQAPDATGVTLVVPDAPTLVAPAPDAPASGASFEWTGGPGGLQYVLLASGVAPSRILIVFVASRSFTLPDLSAAGFTFTAGGAWSASQAVGFNTTDEAAVEGAGAWSPFERKEPPTSGVWSTSERRRFSP